MSQNCVSAISFQWKARLVVCSVKRYKRKVRKEGKKDYLHRKRESKRGRERERERERESK